MLKGSTPSLLLPFTKMALLRRARRHAGAGARGRPVSLRVGGRRGGRRRAGDGEGDRQEALHCAALVPVRERARVAARSC